MIRNKVLYGLLGGTGISYLSSLFESLQIKVILLCVSLLIVGYFSYPFFNE